MLYDNAVKPWKLLLIGVFAGLASGMLGIGGGIIMVPLLLAIGFDRHRAHATSIAAILPIALAGAATFGLGGEIDVGVGITVGLGGVVGSIAGAQMMHRSSPRTLAFVFNVILVLAAVRMILGGGSIAGGGEAGGLAMILVGFLIGVGAGFFAGLSGVGGGVIMVPAFVLLLGFTQHAAQGTSLLAIIFTSISATMVNVRNRRVRLLDALMVGLAGVAGSILGARVALGIEARTLSIAFGVLALVVASQSLIRLFRSQES